MQRYQTSGWQRRDLLEKKLMFQQKSWEHMDMLLLNILILVVNNFLLG
jgi:hypothetical protein